MPWTPYHDRERRLRDALAGETERYFAALRADNQRILGEFIAIEIALGLTFVHAAKVRNGDLRESAIGNAFKCVSTARQFLKKIENPGKQKRLARKIAVLERAVSTL